MNAKWKFFQLTVYHGKNKLLLFWVDIQYINDLLIEEIKHFISIKQLITVIWIFGLWRVQQLNRYISSVSQWISSAVIFLWHPSTHGSKIL